MADKNEDDNLENVSFTTVPPLPPNSSLTRIPPPPPLPGSSNGPSPLPPHPEQTRLINQHEPAQPVNPPRIKFKDAFPENLKSNDSLLNTSPVSRINLKDNTKNRYKNEQTRTENLGINSSKEKLKNNANDFHNLPQEQQQNRLKLTNEIPNCCFAPPCLQYVNGCKEIKVK